MILSERKNMPTIKCMTFRQGSKHHETCSQRRTYLEKDSRALDRTCLNVSDPERWDAEMDRTREQYHLRGCVNYREFILSPDPLDDPSLEQIKELATRWALKNFPTAEVTIVYHDDNKERLALGKQGIVHAHIVVNTVDLVTGKKVVIKDSALRSLHNSAQEIAHDIGLSVQPMYEPGKRLQSQQTSVRTQAERRMEIRGVDAWKSQVRDMALQALSVSTTPSEFKKALAQADVDISMRRGRIYLTDRDNPDRSCRADRLDVSLSAKNLSRTFDEKQVELETKEALTAVLKNELIESMHVRDEFISYKKECAQVLQQLSQTIKNPLKPGMDKTIAQALPTPKTPIQQNYFRSIVEKAQKSIKQNQSRLHAERHSASTYAAHRHHERPTQQRTHSGHELEL